MSHGNGRLYRQQGAYLLGFNVEPEDVEQLGTLHSAARFDGLDGATVNGTRHVDAHIEDDENDEHGYVDRLLGRWQDRPFSKF